MGKTKKTGNLVNVVVTDALDNVTLPKTLTIGEAPGPTDDSLQVPTTSWVNDKLDTKVDKVAGKDLSTNDFTNDLKTKLDGIQAGAEVNVNADWDATSGDALILNKPIIPSIEGLATEIYVDNGLATKQNALGFTPENVANKATDLTSPNNTNYPTTLAVKSALDLKQDLLTNPITGTGTTNYVSKFTASGTIGDSQIFENGTNVGIGTTAATSKLHVVGLPTYADNEKAIAGGLTVGAFYHTEGILKVVIDPNQVIINAFKARVLADIGTFEAESCLLTFLTQIN